MIGECIVKQIGRWRICLFAALVGFSGGAHSFFHLWDINEVYSNASGTVQFIEFTTSSDFQQFVSNHTVTSSDGATTRTFTMGTDLPGSSLNRKFLIGTTSFAALGVVTPDFIMPDGFLFTSNLTINFAENFDVLSNLTLPTDGVLSLNRDLTTGTNSPTNFAGASGTITPPVNTVPDAPVIGAAVGGNTQVTVNFQPPANDGGSAITGYTATCGVQSNSGNGPPIVVGGLANGAAVTCRVIATNAVGSSALSAASNNVTPATVPDPPTIGNAIPGNGEAFISFSPPSGNGGATITGYRATCNPGGLTGTGTVSPITVGGLMNSQLVSCVVTASNSIGAGAESATVDVTPLLNPPLTPVAVLSRKTHTGVGAFDLPIERGVAITGLVSVEPRSVGNGHTIVFRFNLPVTSFNNLSVTPVGTASAAPPAGKELPIILTGVPDNQRVTVSVTDVNGAGVNVDASMGFLVGDVSNSRSVNAGDISSVKARQGQPIDETNFKFDLNATGGINSSDVSVVKARAGVTLPPPP